MKKEKTQVKGFLECKDETDDKLIEFFDRKIRPQLNAEICETAKKVLSYSLIAGALEDLNVEELVPLACEGTLGKLKGVVIASVAQGTMNALTTLRIAVLTKNLLLNADVTQTRRELRRKSYTEAYDTLKEILVSSMENKVAKPIKSLLHKA